MRFKLIVLSIFLCGCGYVNAQNPGTALSAKIAQKMKDSLQLSDSQRISVYVINVQLHNQKMNVRTRYTNSDSIQRHVQRIENTRDSLYSEVLDPEKYQLYIQKKQTLISAN